MDRKKVTGLRLFPGRASFDGTIRETAQGFLYSMQAAGRCTDRTIESYEFSLSLLATYADRQRWPAASVITTDHIVAYLVYLRTRPRWFGDRDAKHLKPVSQSTVETQYRRIKRFFNWMVQREYIERNPLDIIPHPHVDERIIPTVSAKEVAALLRYLDPTSSSAPRGRYRFSYRDGTG